MKGPDAALPFATLYDVSPNVSAIFATPTRYSAANRAYCAAAEVDAATILARGLDAVFAEPEAIEVRESLARVFATGTYEVVTVRPRAGAGTRSWTISNAPLRSPDDPSVQWVLQQVAVIQDQAPHDSELSQVRLLEYVQRSNAALAVQRRELLDILISIPGFVCVVRGPEHLVDLSNQAFTELVGEPAAPGRPFRDAVPRTMSQSLVDLMNRVYSTGAPFAAKGVRLDLPRSEGTDGGRVVVDVSIRALHATSGEVEGVVLAGYDVTANLAAIEAVAWRERELRFLAEAVPVQVWRADTSGGLTYVNPEATEFLGRSIGGSEWGDVMHPDDVGATSERWFRAVATETPYEAEFRLRRHDGVYRWQIARAVPFRDSNGRVLRWHGSTTDIHDRKQAEAERESLIAMLSARTAALQRFAYVLTHDVKAPLRHINSLVGWIRDDLGAQTSTAVDENLRLLSEAAVTLSRLVDGVLRTSLDVAPDTTEVVHSAALIDETIALLGAASLVEIEVSPRPPPVVGPRSAFQQVVLNLLSNALVHGRDGGRIAIEHEVLDETVRFVVRDRGKGVPEAERIAVWGERVVGSSGGGGSGIGLSVVRKLVEARGGTVGIDPTPGGGASVWFTWPRAAAAD